MAVALYRLLYHLPCPRSGGRCHCAAPHARTACGPGRCGGPMGLRPRHLQRRRARALARPCGCGSRRRCCRREGGDLAPAAAAAAAGCAAAACAAWLPVGRPCAAGSVAGRQRGRRGGRSAGAPGRAPASPPGCCCHCCCKRRRPPGAARQDGRNQVVELEGCGFQVSVRVREGFQRGESGSGSNHRGAPEQSPSRSIIKFELELPGSCSLDFTR